MADEQQQQTRVLLLNGQTILLQGDDADNAISEINADLLQQALQGATGETDPVEDTRNDENQFQPPPATENPQINAGNNLVAIFQGDQGETHTIQLTMEQAEALGLHFMSDETEKLTVTPDMPQNVNQSFMDISNDRHQLVHNENTTQPEEAKTMFDPCISADTNITNIQESTTLQGDNNSTSLQQSLGGISSLSEVGSYMGDSSNITLIPQLVNGQMTYTVKLNEPPSNTLPNQDFSVMDNEEDVEPELVEPKPKLPLLAPVLPVSSLSANTPVSVATTTSLRINSIPAMLNTLSPIGASLTQTSTTNTTFAATKSLLPSFSNMTPVDKSTKATYVVVPSSCTTVSASSVVTTPTITPLHVKGSSLIRTIARPVIHNPPPLQLTKTTAAISGTVSTSSLTPNTTTTLTGIPLMNSSINITRSSSTGTSLLQQSTSLSGGGMIRVVAGGSATRMVQTQTTNGPKYTNILTPSGRLVASNAPQPTQQKILAVNSTAGVTKTTSVIASSAVSTTVTTEPLQSSAVSAVQSAAARLNINSTKPLGSSENPIQLVQHGQTFHSVQALSQEQLRQIATVLQQQHLDSAPRTKNVLYDAETNTRIIYRVVYPEDLDLREPPSPSEKQMSGGATMAVTRGRGRRGRPPKAAGRPVGRPSALQDSPSPALARKSIAQGMDLDLDEDRLVDDPSKVERKKQVARTRSGRLSRPPRHMVKDYKRLHHLDFADADLDDSDGGYSDYQMSDREVEDQNGLAKTGMVPQSTQGEGMPMKLEGLSPNPVGTTSLLPGLQVSKRKISSHFRCPTCQKVYLGHSRMARHFDMYPDHGSIDQLKTSASAAPSSPIPLPDSTQGKIGSTLNGIVRPTGGRRRGKRRGPWAYTTPEARSERRKIKLREALVTCEASELSEVAGPAVAGVMSLWELLLLRVEAVRTEESLMATLCEELRALLEKVQSVAGYVLQPATVDGITPKEDQLELQDEILCNALGLPSGKYQIVDDHLLTRKVQPVFDTKLEPPLKRLKSDEENNTKDDLKQEENKPVCPEVLSALALESRPTTVANLNTSTVPPPLPPPPPAVSSTITPTDAPSSHPCSPVMSPDEREPIKTPQDTISHSPDESMKETHVEEAKHVSDQEDVHSFLLPTTTDICVDELSHEPVGSEGEHHGTETVDDIVNERLKNLTGFSVSVPETVPAQEPSQAVVQFPHSHNPTDTEVPTFDPEMALAAMGEGDQPDSGVSLSEFAPEIALAAMGEGDSESQENSSRHSPFASGQPVFDTLKAMEDDVPSTTQAVNTNKEPELSKINRSPRSSEEVFSDMGLGNLNSPHVENSSETKEAIVTFTTSILTNNSENTFITSLAEGGSMNKCEGSNDPSVNNFDPEIALAAMGEGDPAETSTHRMHTDTTFDPEMALASMGEGVSSVPNTQSFSSQRESSGSDSTFQLTEMDVSLDESGPELDFDALSAEFSRTTRHS